MANTFTMDDLVKAIKEVADAEGTKADVAARLGLEEDEGVKKITPMMTTLRKAGVELPVLKRRSSGQSATQLTPEAVKEYNKLLKAKP